MSFYFLNELRKGYGVFFDVVNTLDVVHFVLARKFQVTAWSMLKAVSSLTRAVGVGTRSALGTI